MLTSFVFPSLQLEGTLGLRVELAPGLSVVLAIRVELESNLVLAVTDPIAVSPPFLGNTRIYVLLGQQFIRHQNTLLLLLPNNLILIQHSTWSHIVQIPMQFPPFLIQAPPLKVLILKLSDREYFL